MASLPNAGTAGDAAGPIRPPEALQAMWSESMFEGRSLHFYNGKDTTQESALCRQPSGWVWLHEVASSPCGIVVADLRERRWLKSRGGWVLDGGLLGSLEVAGRRVELYGKRVVRHEPYMEPWPHFWIGAKAWNVSHEFLLLSRNRYGARAAVLRTWAVPDPEASGGYALVVRGRLECQESCGAIRVQVMHAHERDVVSELVPASKAE
jgi:hypothetical protein